MNVVAEELRKRIEDRTVVVGVIGLGYVGLPLGVAFAEAGIRLLGFDVDESKVASIERGESYIGAVTSAQLAAQVDGGRLAATTDFDRLTEADAVLLCVPTPIDEHFEPDLRYVRSAAEQVARTLRKGQLVALESTTYPGTTEELVRPILEAGGSVLDRDYFLAYSPEREDPGNREFRTTQIPKVVGGASEDSLAVALALYDRVVPRTVAVSSTRVAEATKLTENIFRAVNIALVNELKVIYDDLGIDVREVLDAAATKPFGFMRFDPGPGWGGHCIPVDPFYLSWKAREVRRNARFVELAGTVNVEMPRYVVGKLQHALNDRRKSVRGSLILLLGLAYKKNVSDPRESPAFEILDQLLELGAEVSYHDPFVPVAPAMRSWPDLPALRSVDLTREAVEAADAVLLVTDHDGVDYQLVARGADLIVDTRGVFESGENVVRA